MRRALLATLAAWGAAGMTLQAFPVAWGWAHLALSFAFLVPCSWLARSLTRSLPSPSRTEWGVFKALPPITGGQLPLQWYDSRAEAVEAATEWRQLSGRPHDVGWRTVSAWQPDGDGTL